MEMSVVSSEVSVTCPVLTALTLATVSLVCGVAECCLSPGSLGGGGGGPAQQGNGDVSVQTSTASSNGYTCRDCRLLGEHRDALSTLSLHPRPGPTSRIYSRDRSQKRESISSCRDPWPACLSVCG